MFQDDFRHKRRYERQQVNRLAKMRPHHGALPRDCLLTDISDGGVRLHVEGMDVPDYFVLMLTGPLDRGRECHVVWRLGHEIGAEFMDVRQARLRRTQSGG